MKKTIADELPDIAFIMGQFSEINDSGQQIRRFRELYGKLLVASLFEFSSEIKTQDDKNRFYSCNEDHRYSHDFSLLVSLANKLQIEAEELGGRDSAPHDWEYISRSFNDCLCEIQNRTIWPDFKNKILFIQVLIQLLGQKCVSSRGNFRLLSILSKMLISHKEHNKIVSTRKRFKPSSKADAIRGVLQKKSDLSHKDVARWLESDGVISDYSSGEDGEVEWVCNLQEWGKNPISWRRFSNLVSIEKGKIKKI